MCFQKILLTGLERKHLTIKHFGIIILFFISALFFSACSGSGGNDVEKIPVKEIKEKVNSNSVVIETMEASGNIAFDSPEQSGQGWIEVRIRKPDTVYVKIDGPFGISVAQALITRNDFIYYNVQENKAITGPTNDINIGAVLRIKVTFDELISGFSGGFFFEDETNDSDLAESESGFYTILKPETGGLLKYFIDPVLFTVQKYNKFDKNNKTLVEVNYNNYFEELASGKRFYFPANIKIKNPGKKQSVWVDYQNKNFNKPDLNFNVKIPKSAKIINW